MNFEVTILGCNAAVPMHGRHPSAQVLRVRNRLYLIDCGEGTQMRMSAFKIARSRIHQIFISHLHGDHLFGLIGLLTSLSLQDRKDALHVYAPEGVQEIVDVFKKYSQVHFSYPLHIHAIDTTQSNLIHEDDVVQVFSIPLEHRVPCAGFLFKERQSLPSIIPEAIEQYQIPFSEINAIKNGANFVAPDGRIIPHEQLTRPAPAPRSYAYCSDTVYSPSIVPQIMGVNLLYHEATFLSEAADRAKKYAHSTAQEAAKIAAEAKVGMLLIGHYSSKYASSLPLLAEAMRYFPDTVAAEEGKTYPIPQHKIRG